MKQYSAVSESSTTPATNPYFGMQLEVDRGSLNFAIMGHSMHQYQEPTRVVVYIPESSSENRKWQNRQRVDPYIDNLNLNDPALFVSSGPFPKTLVSLFQRLVDQWHEERKGAFSSMAEMIACPSYLRIIGLGANVLPLIIGQLKREGDNPDHWCAALEAITGEDPVPEHAHGNTVLIARQWISWHTDRTHQSFQGLPGRITE